MMYRLVAIDDTGAEVANFDIQRLTLRPEDVLVVKIDIAGLTADDLGRIVRDVARVLPAHQHCLFVPHTTQLCRLEVLPD